MGEQLGLVVGLAQNVALLLALTFLYNVIRPHLRWRKPAARAVVTGILFGVIAIIGMHAPIVVVPGVLADGRVIVVALAGPFGGIGAGLTAGALVSVYRLALGGAGTAAGIGTIATATAIGLAIRWRWGARVRHVGPGAFLLLGLVLDAVVLVWALALPDAALARRVLGILAVPVGLWLPAGTVLLGTLLANERRCEEERERLTLTQFSIDHAADAILWIDAAGRIVQVNPAALRLTGYDRASLLGRPVGDVDRERRPDEWPAFWRDVAARESVAATSEYRRADGTAVPVEISYDFMRFEDQEWISAFVRDATERVLHLAREAALRREAEAANRMKDEFLATLSHELRTPLTSIVGYAHMLKRDPSDAERVRRAVEVIDRNSRLQAKLVDDLLDLTGLMAGKVEIERRPVDLAAVVEMALKSLGPDAEAKSITLTLALEGGATVAGDAARLGQVVTHLADNAIKFTPAGGRVEVRVASDGDAVTLTIKDTGRGIAPGFLPHVFDRFRQGDASLSREYEGLGIGLTIVRYLVTLHGGWARAESDGEGHGATFTVSLPRAPAPARL